MANVPRISIALTEGLADTVRAAVASGTGELESIDDIIAEAHRRHVAGDQRAAIGLPSAGKP